MVISIWFIYILGIIFAIMPSILVKLSVNKYSDKKWLFVTLAIFFYVGLIFVYYKLFRKHNVSKVYAILNIISLICLVIFAHLFFKEKLDSEMIIGIILGIFSIVLIEKFIKF